MNITVCHGWMGKMFNLTSQSIAIVIISNGYRIGGYGSHLTERAINPGENPMLPLRQCSPESVVPLCLLWKRSVIISVATVMTWRIRRNNTPTGLCSQVPRRGGKMSRLSAMAMPVAEELRNALKILALLASPTTSGQLWAERQAYPLALAVQEAISFVWECRGMRS